jgi:hypothetical protein
MADLNDSYKVRNSGNNIAEDVMLEYFKERNVKICRFGFDEKNENIDSQSFFKIPDEIRSAPDYIAIFDHAVFIEVKGFSNSLKVKRKDLVNYAIWNKIMPVYVFVYNAISGKEQLLTLAKLNELVDRAETTYESFPDNDKRYFNITPKE